MPLKLIQREVGPWPMNTYLLICGSSHGSVVVDPGADPDVILEIAQGSRIEKILVTHGHMDHVGALQDLKQSTGAVVYLNPADAARFDLDYDIALQDGDLIQVGEYSLRAIQTPGHTPGMTCFDLGDGRVLVGDTVFVGGPGKTWSAEDFSTTMQTMQEIVFQWADDTRFYPGHGPSGRIGDERPAFEAFVKGGWLPDLYGDVTWA